MKHKFEISYRQYKKVRSSAEAAVKLGYAEVCGIIFTRDGRFIRFEFLENLSTDPMRFRISGDCIRKQSQKLKFAGFNVIGSFHSHPISEAIPSTGDFKHAFLRRTELIYDVCGRNFRMWRLVNRSKSIAREIFIKFPGSSFYEGMK